MSDLAILNPAVTGDVISGGTLQEGRWVKPGKCDNSGPNCLVGQEVGDTVLLAGTRDASGTVLPVTAAAYARLAANAPRLAIKA